MRRLVLYFAVSSLFFLELPFSAADPGDLDTTFGTGGRVTTDIEGNNTFEEIHDLGVQSDGKIVAFGYTNPVPERFAIARYNADGTLDTSFNGDGVNTYNPVSDDQRGESLIILNDGSMILGGSGDTDPNASVDVDFVLVKIESNGDVDTSFGTNGATTTDLGENTDQLASLGRQSDGKIVAVGTNARDNLAVADFGLVRYNEDGSIDTSFGTNGIVTTDFGGLEFGQSAKILSDDKILVGGFTANAGTGKVNGLIARYNADGSLDTSFGSSGSVTTDLGGTANFQINGIGCQSDGKIIAGGTRTPSPTGRGDFLVARYSADGTLDTSFGTSGFARTDFGNNTDDAGRDLLVQDDDKIVIGGITDPDPNVLDDTDMAVIRYNPDGSLDDNATFATDGKQSIDFPDAEDDSAFAVEIQPDGKILIGGFAGIAPNSADFGVARLQSEEADLEISLVASTSPVETGNTYNYEVELTNNGPDAVGGIMVTGDIPAEISFDSASASSGTVNCDASTSSTLSCLVSTLANGGNLTVTVTVNADAVGDPVTLTLTVSAQAVDSDDSNNTASVDVTINQGSGGGSSSGCSLIRP